MDDFFSDEEVQLIVDTIQDLCDRLGWEMRAVAMDDEEGGIAGIILGTSDFLEDIGAGTSGLPDDGQLH